MSKKEDKKIEEFEKSCKFYCDYHKVGKIETIRICGNLKQVVKKALFRQRQESIKEMIKLSDDIENEYGETKFNEWRAFKHFRNTMRDKLKEMEEL